MVMPRLRWPLLAAAGLVLVPARPLPTASVARSSLIPDTAFHVPDSVRALLSAVSRIVVAPDSSLYLSDFRIPSILHLEPSGDFRRAVGRAGGGPGEFYQVFTLGLYRDSLWALDPAQVRVTLFPLSGRGQLTVPFGPYAARSNRPGAYSRRGVPTSLLPDGAVLLEENAPDPTRPTHGLLLRVDRTMRVLDTVAELPAEHSGIVFQHNDGAMYLPQPFSDDPKYGVSVDGSLVVLVTRRTATSEDGAQFTIVGLRNGTERLFARTIAYQPRRLLNRTVDSAVAFLIGDVTRGAPRSPITADSVRRRLYRPAFLPPVSDVRVGRDGTIWLKVRFGDSPANADEWMQLSSRGQPQRRVVTPAGFRLLEADRRMVWGTCADSMDVPEVRRYAVD